MLGTILIMRGYSLIGLYHPKDGKNVGGALRAAMCYGAMGVVVEQHSKHPVGFDHHTDTAKAIRHIPAFAVPLEQAKPQNAAMVAVEICDGAEPLATFQHPERAFYVFGPENGSLPDEIIKAADHVVYVPTKCCMNLAATVNVVLYDRQAKGS